MNRLFIFFLLIPSIAQAVIITVDYVKNTMPELNAKQFILLGDKHVHMPEDIQQLDAFVNDVKKRAQGSREKIHILVEKPAGQMLDGSLISNVIQALHGHDCVAVQNVEMRCCTAAAEHMLKPDRYPDGIWPFVDFDSGYDKRALYSVTIGDIDHEIAYFKQQIDAWAATASPLYAQTIRSLEPEFQDSFNQYKRLCTLIFATSDMRISALSCNLYRTDPRSRAVLWKAISDLSCALFDMHIYKTLMTLQEPDIIILIAGAWHSRGTYGLLTSCGNTTIARYGNTWDSKPLSAKKIALDAGCCACCWMCPIQ